MGVYLRGEQAGVFLPATASYFRELFSRVGLSHGKQGLMSLRHSEARSLLQSSQVRPPTGSRAGVISSGRALPLALMNWFA